MCQKQTVENRHQNLEMFCETMQKEPLRKRPLDKTVGGPLWCLASKTDKLDKACNTAGGMIIIY